MPELVLSSADPDAVVADQVLSLAEFLTYDRILIGFSGGKDSLACLLYMLALGVPRDRIELHHHEVDGREGSTLMDWPCTPAYCRAVAKAFELPLYFSWKVGGFEGEMGRKDAPTGPTRFEVPSGAVVMTGGRSKKKSTRGLFPQVSADLSVRWCSAYLKIMIMDALIRNQARFLDKRTLVITGERGEESTARSKYAMFEPHRADNREGRRPRHVDHYRPVLRWVEREVWAIIERHRVNPHPCYRLGFGRCSCAACIFGSKHQWASLRAANPAQFHGVARKEAATGKTIQRKLSVVQLADQGTPYVMNDADVRAALATTWNEPVILPPGAWKLPRGAYGDSTGPT